MSPQSPAPSARHSRWDEATDEPGLHTATIFIFGSRGRSPHQIQDDVTTTELRNFCMRFYKMPAQPALKNSIRFKKCVINLNSRFLCRTGRFAGLERHFSNQGRRHGVRPEQKPG
jgi:hypothetical protein